MAGGHVKYRSLSRNSSHRQALLRNLVTSLIKHESIQTTWHKAKEAQRLAEKLITLGKRNTEAARNRAMGIFFVRLSTVPKAASHKQHLTHKSQEPHKMLPILFGPIRERYANRPGGYTRVLRVEPLKEDQAASAILELVDGPKDMRFALTAKTLARLKAEGKEINEVTAGNMEKVTRFREGGKVQLDEMVQRIMDLEENDEVVMEEPKKRRVYPEQKKSR
ncbi:hypothetical protein MBLNU457_g0387t1 [Dothideomycetes sp. NU457]